MKSLLAKYGYRAFMEGEGAGSGGGADDGAAAAAAAAAEAKPAAAPTALERAASGASGDPKPVEQKPAADAWKEYADDPAKTPEENAAAKAEHDKTKPADDGKAKEGDAIDPSTYQIDTPEGFEVDEG